MITYDVVYAMDLMIELREDKTLAKAMDAMRDMLCAFYMNEWLGWTGQERREWIAKWLVYAKGESNEY